MSLDFIRPEFLTPFMFGFSTPFLLKLWNKWQKGCILTIFLLWVYFVWFSYIALMLRSFPTYTTAFFVGFAIAFSWTFLKSSFAVFAYLADKLQDIRYFIIDRRQAKQSEWAYQNQRTGYQQDRQQREHEAEAERRRREEDARQFREQNNKKQNQRPNDHSDKTHQQETKNERQGYKNHHENRERIKDEYKPEPPEEKRTYEQILGLSAGWTQADLKEAYRRESQRTHTDKWVGKPRHIQQAMEEEFKLIQEAYKKLKK